MAEAIGQVLREGGAEVDVRPVKTVGSLAGYDALVLGSAIWAGKPLPEARRFAAAQRSAFANLPVAYFALCETLREDTPASRDKARRFLAPLQKIKRPVSLALFAGKKDYSSVHPLVRWVMVNLVKLPEGDWRDWPRIRAWAAELGAALASAPPVAVAGGRY